MGRGGYNKVVELIPLKREQDGRLPEFLNKVSGIPLLMIRTKLE